MLNLFRSALTFVLTLICTLVISQNWPTYMCDAQRSGQSNAELNLPLYLQWEYSPACLPAPAWPAPAKTDYWHREANLKPRVIFDRAYHVVANSNSVFFGSSSNDKVYCLDALTGKERWSFFSGGPIRLAPTLHNNNLYFGSDDGYVYCLNSKNGNLIWKINTAESKRLIPGNERIISISPIRTGILVYENIAYFCSGIFPTEKVSMYAINTISGDIIWKKSNLEISPQGYMLATSNELFVPTGRTTPTIFDRKTSEAKGKFKGNGGTYALVTNDTLIYGGGDLGQLDYAASEKNKIVSFNGVQMLVNGNVSFLRNDDEISAINRSKYLSNFTKWEKITDKSNDLADNIWDLREQREVALSLKKDITDIDNKIEKLISKGDQISTLKQNIESGGVLWKYQIKETYSMILAGNKLIVGGNNRIEIINTLNGNLIGTGSLKGKVYGLSITNNRLYASTETGKIYCFSTSAKTESDKIMTIVDDKFYQSYKDKTTFKKIADDIIKKSNVTKGYCLLIGSDDGKLAYELAKKTKLKIVCLENDPEKIQTARNYLNKAGLYGSRVTIQNGSSTSLPYTRNFANLIVWIGVENKNQLTTSANEILRVAKPFGGKVYIDCKTIGPSGLKSWMNTISQPNWEIINDDFLWAHFEKGIEPGFGEWTHQYANVGNTSNSMDKIKGPMQIQWFGKPGPQKMINRHSRTVSPLVKDGRLFVPADNRVITVDAYNGTLLWEKSIPGSRVLGALKDASNRVVTKDLFYIAANNECIGLDVKDGSEKIRIKTPQLTPGVPHDWGYISVVDNQLFGSGKKQGATFTILGRLNCDDFEGDFREMVMSDYLFSFDRKTGKELWTYKNGVVFNNAITIGNDYIYFIESRNKRAVNDPDGRIRLDYYFEKETFIVKLNKSTGEVIWEKPYLFPFEQIMYLSFADNKLLVTGSYNKGRNVHYGLFTFNETGELLWKNSYQGQEIGGSHGEQWQHPVIIDNTIYLFPYEFNFQTGKKGDIYLTKSGCGGFSGSANNLFARKSNPTMFSLDGGIREGTPLTKVNRPGCWINIIPAGGLIAVPESSSGCTCDYPVQTSFVFISDKN